MASSATRRRSGNPARSKPAKSARRKASATTALAKQAGRGPVRRKVATKAAGKGIKRIGAKALRSGAEAVRAAASRSAEVTRTAIEKRAPIQVSVDVAVPLKIAWDEWMSFTAFTEGVHHIEDVERDGDSLTGRTAGSRPMEWAADIVDEREEQSFAWRSVEGTDCAGLVTFHRLSDRLTRIELDLDVLPRRPAEAVSLALHIADRRAESDLRRFKAEVEFISPEVYEDELAENGKGPKKSRKRQNAE